MRLSDAEQMHNGKSLRPLDGIAEGRLLGQLEGILAKLRVYGQLFVRFRGRKFSRGNDRSLKLARDFSEIRTFLKESLGEIIGPVRHSLQRIHPFLSG